jgi:hypothetical protein
MVQMKNTGDIGVGLSLSERAEADRAKNISFARINDSLLG